MNHNTEDIMNTNTTDEANVTELEHCDGRSSPHLASDGQRADDTATSGEQATDQAAATPPPPFIVGQSIVGRDTLGPDQRTAVYDDPARGYGCVYAGDQAVANEAPAASIGATAKPDPTKVLVCDESVADADGNFPPFAE